MALYSRDTKNPWLGRGVDRKIYADITLPREGDCYNRASLEVIFNGRMKNKKTFSDYRRFTVLREIITFCRGLGLRRER